MEWKPFSTAEDEQSKDDDDEELKDKGKSTTKIAHVPLSKIAVPKPAEQSPEEKPLSLLESLRKSREEKERKEIEAAELQSREEALDEEDAEAADAFLSKKTDTVPDLDQGEHIEDQDTELATSESVETENDEDFAEWEGEFESDGEIPLSRPSTETKEETAPAPEGVKRPVYADTNEEPPQEENEAVTPLANEAAPLTEDEPTVPLETDVDLGGGGEGPPPEVPEGPIEDASEPEPIRPAYVPTPSFSEGYFEPPVTTRREAAAPDIRAIERARADAEYYAEKRGVRKGLVAGLAFGWLVGRRGKKKMARGFEKELKAKDSELKQIKSEQAISQERLSTFKQTQEHLQTVIREKEREIPAAQVALEAVAEARQASTAAVPRPERTPEISQLPPEVLVAPFAIGSREHVRYSIDEKGRVQAERTPGLAEKEIIKELSPEEQEITEATYLAPEGRRVETSSWHRIEIDKKTGQVIDNPEIAYGEEFKREKQKEVLRANRMGSVGAAAKLGGMAAIAGASQDSSLVSSSQGISTSSSAHSSSFADGTTSDPVLPAHKQIERNILSPTIWVVGILFVIVLFIIGVLR